MEEHKGKRRSKYAKRVFVEIKFQLLDLSTTKLQRYIYFLFVLVDLVVLVCFLILDGLFDLNA